MHGNYTGFLASLNFILGAINIRFWQTVVIYFLGSEINIEMWFQIKRVDLIQATVNLHI